MRWKLFLVKGTMRIETIIKTDKIPEMPEMAFPGLLYTFWVYFAL